MTPRQQQVVYVLLLFMLGLYVTPPVGAAVAALFGDLNGNRTAGTLFLALVATPSGFIPILQKFLAPLTAGISTAVLWSEKFAGKVIVLLVVAATGIVATIFLFLYLGITGNAQELWEPAGLASVQNAETFEPLKDHYLSGMLESLLAFVAIVVGLQAVPSKQE